MTELQKAISRLLCIEQYIGNLLVIPYYLWYIDKRAYSYPS